MLRSGMAVVDRLFLLGAWPRERGAFDVPNLGSRYVRSVSVPTSRFELLTAAGCEATPVLGFVCRGTLPAYMNCP